MSAKVKDSRPAFPFDPTYGYSLEELLAVPAPEAPDGFEDRWQNWYREARALDPAPGIRDTRKTLGHWRVFDVWYRSTNDREIGGWLLLPNSGRIERAFIVGHGYGGRDAPDLHLPFPDAALLFPCARGISRSATIQIPASPDRHVVHNIEDPENYVLRGCVEDTWIAVSALLEMHPEVVGRIGYLGISFSGGIGALALQCENRIARAHVNVPTFGNQALRLQLKSTGSAASVQKLHKKNPKIEETLRWYDAATAAQLIKMPVHFACALADPAVAPPGQFAVHNAVPDKKRLYVLQAGHMEYEEKEEQETELLQELRLFFGKL